MRSDACPPSGGRNAPLGLHRLSAGSLFTVTRARQRILVDVAGEDGYRRIVALEDSMSAMASEYGSSPVAAAADHRRAVPRRGLPTCVLGREIECRGDGRTR